jgi:threonine synthase
VDSNCLRLHIVELTGARVYLKVEGMNPTGSFKDRGMTMAITDAARNGAKAVVCASTGNTSASAAAYATKAGMKSAVLVPQGKIAMGKLAQAVIHGATILQVDGNFDDCLDIARDLAENYPIALVNSVNPTRLQGQKTAAFEIVDALGDAPDIHCLPVGNLETFLLTDGLYQYYRQDFNSVHKWGFGRAVYGCRSSIESQRQLQLQFELKASIDLAVAAAMICGLIDAVSDDQIGSLSSAGRQRRILRRHQAPLRLPDFCSSQAWISCWFNNRLYRNW